MKTDPVLWVLNRDLARVNAKPISDVSSSLLSEVVNFATTAFAIVATTSRGAENEDLAPFYLYLHTIEMADAAQLLAKEACATAIVPLARSSFEAHLALQYILERSELFSQRSLAWTYVSYRTRRDTYHSLDPEHERGKQARADFENDAVLEPFAIPPEQVRAAAANLDRLLSASQFAEIAAEWESCRRTLKKSSLSWHQLFGGPGNLEDLARHLNRAAEYRFLYRQMSTIAHARDPSRLVRHIAGKAELPTLLRAESNELRNISSIMARTLIATTHLLLNHFRHGEVENFKKWYEAKCKPSFDSLFPD